MKSHDISGCYRARKQYCQFRYGFLRRMPCIPYQSKNLSHEKTWGRSIWSQPLIQWIQRNGDSDVTRGSPPQSVPGPLSAACKLPACQSNRVRSHLQPIAFQARPRKRPQEPPNSPPAESKPGFAIPILPRKTTSVKLNANKTELSITNVTLEMGTAHVQKVAYETLALFHNPTHFEGLTDRFIVPHASPPKPEARSPTPEANSRKPGTATALPATATALPG